MTEKKVDLFNVFMALLLAFLAAALVGFGIKWPYVWESWVFGGLAAVIVMVLVNSVTPFEDDGGPNL